MQKPDETRPRAKRPKKPAPGRAPEKPTVVQRRKPPSRANPVVQVTLNDQEMSLLDSLIATSERGSGVKLCRAAMMRYCLQRVAAVAGVSSAPEIEKRG